jgi:hypothetical protein
MDWMFPVDMHRGSKHCHIIRTALDKHTAWPKKQEPDATKEFCPTDAQRLDRKGTVSFW